MSGCDFLIFPSEMVKYPLPHWPPIATEGEKMITGALNTIFVELVFFLTLGDQIDRQSSSWGKKKKSHDWNTARGSFSGSARVHYDIAKFKINDIWGDTHISINLKREMQILKWLIIILTSESLFQKIRYNEIDFPRPCMASHL